ncbi:MAG: serpin family protein [Coriobacteriales bacterium]|jgi:serpin B|nr:serpin family protein [Coriobacteriales bacterium]
MTRKRPITAKTHAGSGVIARAALASILLASALLLGSCGPAPSGGPVSSASDSDLALPATIGKPVQASLLLSDVDAVSAESFESAAADFSVELFKRARTPESNSLVSPLSVALALAMAANGAEGETLAEMEQALGGITLDDLNEACASIVKHLPQEDNLHMLIADSVWLKDTESLTINDEYLSSLQGVFGAEAHKSAFDEGTVSEINDWVSHNTDGMITRLIDRIDPFALLFLINAVTFEAEWQTPYNNADIVPGAFTNMRGETRLVDYLCSDEARYLEDDEAIGVVKPYAGGRYGFVGILPKEGTSLESYIDSLTGEELRALLTSGMEAKVKTSIPRFTSEYDTELSDALTAIGMRKAFDAQSADFGRMGTYAPSEGTHVSLYVSAVLHKTFIEVSEWGTRAAAATSVQVTAGAAAGEPESKAVSLNQPFLYAIIDIESGLPLFIGTVNDVRA